MLINTNQHLQFDELETVQEWVSAYQRHGLPAHPDGAGLILMLTGKDVAAVHMPDFLGRHAQQWLRQCMVSGPVLSRAASDGTARWTFLAFPNITPRMETTAALSVTGATLCLDGTPIQLPASITRDVNALSWAYPPQPGRDLPLLSAVICAARVAAKAEQTA